jgi:hypothetical protein
MVDCRVLSKMVFDSFILSILLLSKLLIVLLLSKNQLLQYCCKIDAMMCIRIQTFCVDQSTFVVEDNSKKLLK